MKEEVGEKDARVQELVGKVRDLERQVGVREGEIQRLGLMYRGGQGWDGVKQGWDREKESEKVEKMVK